MSLPRRNNSDQFATRVAEPVPQMSLDSYYFPAAAIHPTKPLVATTCRSAGGTLHIHEIVDAGFFKEGITQQQKQFPLPSAVSEMFFDPNPRTPDLILALGADRIARYTLGASKPRQGMTYSANPATDKDSVAAQWSTLSTLTALSGSPSGAMSAVRGRSVFIWDPTRQVPARELVPSKSPTLATAWSPRQASLLATAGQSSSIRAYDLRSPHPIELADCLAPVTALAWSPFCTNLLISGDDAGTIQVWDTRASRSVYTVDTLSPIRPRCLGWSPSHPEMVVAGGVDGSVGIYSVLRDEPDAVIGRPGQNIADVFAEHPPRTVEAITALWNKPSRPPPGLLSSVGFTACSPGQVVAAYTDGTIMTHTPKRALFDSLSELFIDSNDDLKAELQNLYVNDVEGAINEAVSKVSDMLDAKASDRAVAARLSSVESIIRGGQGAESIDTLADCSIEVKEVVGTLGRPVTKQTRATFDCMAAAARVATALNNNDTAQLDGLQAHFLRLVGQAAKPLRPFVRDTLDTLLRTRIDSSVEDGGALLLALPADTPPSAWNTLAVKCIMPTTLHEIRASTVRTILAVCQSLLTGSHYTPARCHHIMTSFSEFDSLADDSKQSAVIRNELAGDLLKAELAMQAEIFSCIAASDTPIALLERIGERHPLSARVLYAAIYAALAVGHFPLFTKLAALDPIKSSVSARELVTKIKAEVMWPLVMQSLTKAKEASLDVCLSALTAVSVTMRLSTEPVPAELHKTMPSALRMLSIRVVEATQAGTVKASDANKLAALLSSPDAAGKTGLDSTIENLREILEPTMLAGI
ncbi:WD domain, G-beta repeat [Carpediemonas membranifera]|uniref:WD domain, G-beta repeat n=1 Tax=Carpediemonas membranifera TaxID=201153 RepID=A0A8J6AVP0_9EUKA|nr:WD domain, G-beta repeat [Carpediemonas membranifera]|eukprot:KAG9393680.1 WD domain, G-beta repeat [Carpediemonas membranifera]